MAVICIGQITLKVFFVSACALFFAFASNGLDVDAAKIELGKACFLQAEPMIEKLRAINRACGGESVIAESIFLLIKLFHLSLSLARTHAVSLYFACGSIYLYFFLPRRVCAFCAALICEARFAACAVA